MLSRTHKILELASKAAASSGSFEEMEDENKGSQNKSKDLFIHTTQSLSENVESEIEDTSLKILSSTQIEDIISDNTFLTPSFINDMTNTADISSILLIGNCHLSNGGLLDDTQHVSFTALDKPNNDPLTIVDEYVVNGTEMKKVHEITDPPRVLQFANDGSSIVMIMPNTLNEVTEQTEVTAEIKELEQSREKSSDFNKDSTYEASHTDSSHLNNSQSSEETLNLSVPAATVPLDDRHLDVPSSKGGDNNIVKKYFCPYCKKLLTKFARHLEVKHKNEEDVKKFLRLPAKNILRKQLIDKIRKYGNFLHNTDPAHNTGMLIPCRRPQAKFKCSAKDFVACSHCKGLFSKKTLRIHYMRCNPKHVKGKRGQLQAGRKLLGYCHSEASGPLRNEVLSSLNPDEVADVIKYDQLLILYGNKETDNYTLVQQNEMIRSHLRLLARFLIEVRKIDKNVTDFTSVFHPKFYRSVVAAVRVCAQYDPVEKIFKVPSNGIAIGGLLKKIAVVNKARCVEYELDEERRQMERFFELFADDYPLSINKKCLEDMAKARRIKKIVLPTKDDIQKLYIHVKLICEKSMGILAKGFNRPAWISLGQASLIFLQMFNRRRAGEIERLLLENYDTKATLDAAMNVDLHRNLSEAARRQASQFVRLTIRGKKDRDVPVLLHHFLVQYIDTLLKYRKRAGVVSSNKFLFAVPLIKKRRLQYLRACPLMRKFSDNCGAAVPSTLRGTILRKHIASYTAMLRLEDDQVDFLCNYMGHHKDVHRNIYRVSNDVADMTEVSLLLQKAIGEDEDEGEDDSDSAESDGEVAPDNPVLDPPEAPNDVAGPSNMPENYTRASSLENDLEADGENGLAFSDEDEESDRYQPSGSKSRSQKRLRKVSPRGQIKRQKWSDEERSLVKSHFGDPKSIAKLPSQDACRKFLNKYSTIFKNRTPDRLKSWIDNQRKAKARKIANKKKRDY